MCVWGGGGGGGERGVAGIEIFGAYELFLGYRCSCGAVG